MNYFSNLVSHHLVKVNSLVFLVMLSCPVCLPALAINRADTATPIKTTATRNENRSAGIEAHSFAAISLWQIGEPSFSVTSFSAMNNALIFAPVYPDSELSLYGTSDDRSGNEKKLPGFVFSNQSESCRAFFDASVLDPSKTEHRRTLFNPPGSQITPAQMDQTLRLGARITGE